MCYNINIMKKILIIFVAILTITSLIFVFAGCSEGFSKNSIRKQIETNLRWNENAIEICNYDVMKDGVKIGEYASTLELYNKPVEIIASNEEANAKLDSFTGYKFTTSMTAQLDGKTFARETQSYATLRLEPKLSYVKTTEDETEEIITSYASKKTHVTFIKNGEVTTASSKYGNSAFVVDNSYLYQFARTTTLSSAVTIVVPTYNTQDSKTANSSFSCSYANGGSVILPTKFVLRKSFSETIASGDIPSGVPTSSGFADSEDDVTSVEDESGNVTTTYPYTLTSSIPVVNCKFTTSKSFPASGSISCMIASSPLKTQSEGLFAERVVVRFVEDKIEYNLKSIVYTKR